MDSLEFQKRQVKNNMLKILEIIYMYYKLDGIKDFVVDLQIYHDKHETEPRIWLSAPNNNLGISLMLYSIKLSDYDGKVENNQAIEVLSEYIKFYSENENLFRLYHDKNDNYKPLASISFEISNRNR